MNMKAEAIKNIITIGTSAGGFSAIAKLVASFKQDLDAAVFIVIHLSGNSNSEIVLKGIQKHTQLKCRVAEDQQEIQNRTIYLAKADHHLLLTKGRILVTKGAFENHWRPAIDVLFRSAAAAYGSCVTGIILTGLLDDGVSGMFAIKRSGGLCIVQDPAEAEFPDMPNSVLNAMEVDYKVAVNEIGHILTDRFSHTVCVKKEVPADVKLEAEITRRMTTSMKDLTKLGEFSHLTCPECGGTMVKIANDAVPRYRCYTGHSFTERIFEDQQLKGIEDSVWVAIRMMEERKNLLMNMSRPDPADRNSRAHAI
ncbi:two-component system chemotaxis response regulator CheB [Pedobacter cryoconitis]|uniref:protein-glutamate methylesterase n=2 Tax=Pedobacter cryoconitis TaxID=188932 RepID=A0A327RZ62_9SPHI|nr:two-component system chemotaxis response regulator CheB [Pedobacter cryoconitis]